MAAEALTDSFYEKENIAHWNELAEQELGRISEYTPAHSEDEERAVCSLIRSSGDEGLNDKNYKLLVLSILMKAEEKELSDALPQRVFTGRTVDELTELYENLVFYLRRLEFRMPLELCVPLVDYMVAEHVSITLIVTVITETTYLYRKQEILDRLSSLLGGSYE